MIESQYESILEQINRLTTNMMKAVAGNKAAAARSRKDSMKLAEMLKEWRRLTISETK